MKTYDLIAIGTGSVINIVEAMIIENPNIRVAVIDKDEPGGICLTRGCIPSKLLLYPAELLRTFENVKIFGINFEIKGIDFKKVMERMRKLIQTDIDKVRRGLSQSKNIDYYNETAEFVDPYKLKVGNQTITSKMILLGTGSKPNIPPIKGIDKIAFLTSDTILKISELPKSVIIVGGGYIAAEYGHFLSSMGSKVTIIGRNPQFIPEEEPEISKLAKKELEKNMVIYLNYEAKELKQTSNGKKQIIAVNRETGKKIKINSDEILIATGRSSLSEILKPEKAGIKTDQKGWITVNEYLETSQKNVWALGDANGNYPFKHVANYEAQTVFYNAILKNRTKINYLA